ncbi:hypothetical protein CFC21_079467 [Triticum aestivum]|uniref:Uncharacterized protein n=2 Tax=Triticum aestivum TaxID=4565 RepID=A0A3B6MZ45_WHEAT|nr:hypothetical protein CFC21_079467 [Triticum aestivum]
MEPVIHGRPASLDVNYPIIADQNTLVCLVNITHPKPAFLPWLKRVFRQQLGITAVRFAGCTILPHNVGGNAFSFSYRHVVNLSLEKLPVELWNRRGVAASVACFASLFQVEHACLHGSEFTSIFVLVKVEALLHIPHHLTFHRIDGNGIYADVIINEVWHVARSLGAPTVPPCAPDGHAGGAVGDADGSDAGFRPPTLPRQGHAHPRMSSGVSVKPKLIKGAAFTTPTAVQVEHEDEVRLCLHASLLAADVRKPRASVTFDLEELCFSFKLELGHCRSTSGVIQFWPTLMDDGLCPRTMPLLPAVESKYRPKPNVPTSLLPTVGPLLSLAQGDLFPMEAHFPAHEHLRAHQFLTTQPICSRHANCVPTPEPVADQPLPGSASAVPMVLGSSKSAGHQARDTAPAETEVAALSPRCSPRIRSAYDGVRIGLVERASKWKAASDSSSSSGSSRCFGPSSSRCKKAKAAIVAALLELPLLETPALMTRGKLKQVA